MDEEEFINVKAVFHVLRINFLARIYGTSPDLLLKWIMDTAMQNLPRINK